MERNDLNMLICHFFGKSDLTHSILYVVFVSQLLFVVSLIHVKLKEVISRVGEFAVVLFALLCVIEAHILP